MSVWLTICHHPAHHREFLGLLMATYSLVWSYQTTCALEALNIPRSTVGQPRATFDLPAIPERERMQLAGNCSLQDNLLAMEKQCHPTLSCLRCVPDIQTLGCDSGACSVALPSSILSQKERAPETDSKSAGLTVFLCSCAVCLQGMGAWSRLPRSALAPSPSCSLQPWQSLRAWWGCVEEQEHFRACVVSIRNLVWVVSWLHQKQRRVHNSPMSG